MHASYLRGFSYQWRKDGVDLVGATSDTSSLLFAPTNQAGSYTVVVSNPVGSVTSAPPTVLTVNAGAPGTVVAWGANDDGQTTVPVAAQSGVTAIAAGQYHTVALLGTGLVMPSLNARPTGNQLILSWPTNEAGFTLQSTLNLTPPLTWIDSTTSPAVLGEQFTVTNTISGSAQFYRLRRP